MFKLSRQKIYEINKIFINQQNRKKRSMIGNKTPMNSINNLHKEIQQTIEQTNSINLVKHKCKSLNDGLDFEFKHIPDNETLKITIEVTLNQLIIGNIKFEKVYSEDQFVFETLPNIGFYYKTYNKSLDTVKDFLKKYFESILNVYNTFK